MRLEKKLNENMLDNDTNQATNTENNFGLKKQRVVNFDA